MSCSPCRLPSGSENSGAPPLRKPSTMTKHGKSRFRLIVSKIRRRLRRTKSFVKRRKSQISGFFDKSQSPTQSDLTDESEQQRCDEKATQEKDQTVSDDHQVEKSENVADIPKSPPSENESDHDASLEPSPPTQVTTPRKSKSVSSIRLIPNLSTPGSSRRWSVSVMEKLNQTHPSMRDLALPQLIPNDQSSSTEVDVPNGGYTLDHFVIQDTAATTNIPKPPRSLRLHLYEMSISRQLQSSSISSPGQSSLAMDERIMANWRRSSQCFRSDDIPNSWGQVVSPSSSVYSSPRHGSPALSESDLPAPSKEVRSLDSALSDTRLHIYADGSIDPPPSQPTTSLPTAPSTSSLVKESKFKEEIRERESSNKRPSFLLSPYSFTKGARERSQTSNASKSLLESGSASNRMSRSGSVFHRIDKLVTRTRSQIHSDLEHNESNGKELKDKNRTSSVRSGIVGPPNTPRKSNDQVTDDAMVYLSQRSDAVGLFCKAIKTSEDERSVFFLSEHKEQAKRPQPRPRSASYCLPPRPEFSHGFESADTPLLAERSASFAHLKHRPSFTTHKSSYGNFLAVPGQEQVAPQAENDDKDGASHSGKSSESSHAGRQRTDSVLTTSRTQPELLSRRSILNSLDFSDELVGAWGRYPSHTRPQRTSSAGAADWIQTRDFAYDFDIANICEDGTDDDVVGLRGLDGGKRKHRRGKSKRGTIRKASQIFRHYKEFFSSPSIEYLIYGHGRRTSIAQGGEAKDPDLEMLPEVFAPFPIQEAQPVKTTVERPQTEQKPRQLSLPESQLSPGTSIRLAISRRASMESNAQARPSEDRSHGMTLTVDDAMCLPQHDMSDKGKQHARKESIMSIKQSSYDLLLKLQTVEENQRKKAMANGMKPEVKIVC